MNTRVRASEQGGARLKFIVVVAIIAVCLVYGVTTAVDAAPYSYDAPVATRVGTHSSTAERFRSWSCGLGMVCPELGRASRCVYDDPRPALSLPQKRKASSDSIVTVSIHGPKSSWPVSEMYQFV